LRSEWRGNVDFFATGTNLASDEGGDSGTVETDIQPQTVTVRSPEDIPAGSIVEEVLLYWAGSQPNRDCSGRLDNAVSVTLPDGTVLGEDHVLADLCYCGLGQNSYDQQVCRYSLTDDLSAAESPFVGNYSVGDFNARISDAATDNASFSIVVVYRHQAIPTQHVLLYDGIWELHSGHDEAAHREVVFSLAGFEVDTVPVGQLTYYVIEGDMLAGAGEQVRVEGSPGGTSVILVDSVNTTSNPFNRTINTVVPIRTSVVGVDIDQFDISSAIATADTSVDVTFSAGRDKVWVIYNVISIGVFEPVFSAFSTLVWELWDDRDSNLGPTEDDTLRFTLHLENSGNETGTIDFALPMPDLVLEWSEVDFSSAGENVSGDRVIAFDQIPTEVGEEHEYVFDLVVAEVSEDQTPLDMIVTYTDPAEGGSGGTIQTRVLLRLDRDGDLRFDNDDNCPDIPNPDQADEDGDEVGDLCDDCPLDPLDDSDGDHVCDSEDTCAGGDDSLDEDRDTVPDFCDVCEGDDRLDDDEDSVPDECDVCPEQNDRADSDRDGVPDGCDICAGSNDNLDSDSDGIPNGCDSCPDSDDAADQDEDGVPDACDDCEGDNRLDHDGDGAPDECDVCAGADDFLDTDRDGVPDACDACPGGNDLDDQDEDGIPDSCDECDAGDDNADDDEDGVVNSCDLCPGGDDDRDDDQDGVPDECDQCPGEDDALDSDEDGIPDGCDTESCEDGVDNNGDSLVDCLDEACLSADACVTEPTEDRVEGTLEPRPDSEQDAGSLNAGGGDLTGPEACSCRATSGTGLLWHLLLFGGLLFLRRGSGRRE